MTEPPVVSSSYPSLAAHPKAATPASAAPAGRAPILVLSGLTKRYGAVLASDAVSLDVRRGEIHALIGPNGAGKSTLVKQVSGEISPDQGRVLVDGVDVTDQSAPERARAGLARCFQVSALALELTALQNVMLAVIGRTGRTYRMFARASRDGALVDEAHAHLKRVGLDEHAMRPAGALAHGQRRLLEMAIALALKPKLFLLDEPMAGLDATGSQQLTGVLDTLRHEAPILLVEHDMDAVFALADRISVLVYGRIIATGPVDEIRANRAVRDAYLGEAD